MATPAYRKVYTELKREIKAGTYKPGMLLPTESQLEEQFSVSKTTIRKAVGLLANEGYLKTKQGKGTEVLEFSTTQKLNHFSSLTETLRAKGCTVTTRSMHITRVPAPDYVARQLEIAPGTTVFMVQRVQLADNQPIALMVNYVKETAAPDLDKHTGNFIGLYEFLEAHYHIIFTSGYERISAVNADFTEAQILQIPVGAALLCSHRTSYTEQGPIEYDTIKLVGDRYEYSVYLHGRH